MSGIEYFYAPHSVFAYIGAERFMRIARDAGRPILHRPVDLARVVEAAHPQGFAQRSKAHRAYFFGREIERWAEYRSVPMKGGIPANHGHDTTLACCLLIAAAGTGQGANGLALAMMRAHWRDHADLGDAGTLGALVREAGHDPDALFAAARAADTRARLEANTDEAVARGFFGSPTYVVDGDMFYGQDRLELVERALARPFARHWS